MDSTTPLEAPSGTVLVTEVAGLGEEFITWTFDTAITSPPISAGAFAITGFTPVGIVDVGPANVIVEYNNFIPNGTPWSLTETPAFMEFADEETLVLPQSGLVLVP